MSASNVRDLRPVVDLANQPLPELSPVPHAAKGPASRSTDPGVSSRTVTFLSVGEPFVVSKGLFAYLMKTGRDAAHLSDSFYLRVGATLGGRLPRHKVLV